eukprot:937021-Prymnesium_polylepis.2
MAVWIETAPEAAALPAPCHLSCTFRCCKLFGCRLSLLAPLSSHALLVLTPSLCSRDRQATALGLAPLIDGCTVDCLLRLGCAGGSALASRLLLGLLYHCEIACSRGAHVHHAVDRLRGRAI